MSLLKLKIPCDNKCLIDLQAGDQVLISGTIFTARDAAHKRMFEAVEKGEDLPFDIKDQFIYYVGPTPAMPWMVIGSAGPTTSSRMDKYTPTLLDMGLKGMIGKGYRSEEVVASIVKNKAVYLAAIGGTGALISRTIKEMEVVAYKELGPEAIYKLTVEDFPATVIIDSQGSDWYSIGKTIFNDTKNKEKTQS
nr:Fe-S-containing hydro-lyase [Cytobacillus purgationiresistens]